MQSDVKTGGVSSSCKLITLFVDTVWQLLFLCVGAKSIILVFCSILLKGVKSTYESCYLTIKTDVNVETLSGFSVSLKLAVKGALKMTLN